MAAKSIIPRAVLFDCDGTLLDSMPLWHAMETRLSWRAGIKLADDLVATLNANTLSQTAAYFHEEHGLGASTQALFDDCSASLRNAYRTRVKPKLGAVELLEALQQRGVKMAVVSSSPYDFLQAGFERTSLLRFFEFVASAEFENASKRDPRFIQACVDRLGVEPQDALMIDDSAYALAVARSIGMRTIGVYDSDDAGTPRELACAADMVLASLADLDIEAIFGRNTNDYE